MGQPASTHFSITIPPDGLGFSCFPMRIERRRLRRRLGEWNIDHRSFRGRTEHLDFDQARENQEQHPGGEGDMKPNAGG